MLALTVFLCGAVVLILEILGSRLLAPYFGTTQFVWSSLIAVTLLALSVGYAGGGRLADRRAPLPLLYKMLVLAGWLVVAISPVRYGLLPLTAGLGIRAGALASAALLLALPLGLLGAVAPLAAKAAVEHLGSLGLRVGGLYALSTLGSLVGALAAGFVLIPLLGVSRILSLSAGLLFLPALWYWYVSSEDSDRRWWRLLGVVGALVCAAGLLAREAYPVERTGSLWRILHKTESRYAQVKVVQYRSSRILLLNGTLQTGTDTSRDRSIFPYVAGATALLRAAHPSARRVLLVGFGGGVMQRILEGEYGMEVDAVEIDPAVARAARDYFDADLGRVKIGDGRAALAVTPRGTYDIIMLDAYAGESPPSHLFTVEAYELVRRALAPGGVGLANLICAPAGEVAGRLARSVGRTLQAVFPWVEAYAMDDEPVTNVLYCFGEEPRTLASLPAVPVHPQVAVEVDGLLDRRVAFDDGPSRVFADDYVPLESLHAHAEERMRAHLQELIPAWVMLE